jgi:hypothetical protein
LRILPNDLSSGAEDIRALLLRSHVVHEPLAHTSCQFYERMQLLPALDRNLIYPSSSVTPSPRQWRQGCSRCITLRIALVISPLTFGI